MDSQSSNDDQVVLRLYVADKAPHSVQALTNLEAILETHASPDRCRLEVVDVLEEPLRALEDGVFVTPTLTEVAPNPVRIVGSLNDRERVARLLGLEGG